MPWQIPWPEFLKKRLCRYLLQHYLGHFFKEKISLEQLSIDIYNGTGCVKNLHLDCDALNEQLNSASANNINGLSNVPIEIVNGFVGYISVYIPWHDLFNDYCKLTIKNVQIIIRTKQRKNNSQNFFSKTTNFSTNRKNSDDDELSSMFSDESDSNSNSMFSSVLIDSIMNTSMHIAQECLNEESFELFNQDNKNTNKKDSSSSDNETKMNSLLGLEAFASTIDSILSRIKINLEQIQIRIENIENEKQHDLMSSSTIFQNRPSNGIAIELRIKSIKYFDLDSAVQMNSSNNQQSLDSNLNLNSLGYTNLSRNTTKSFNIEGLTIYFDEFVIKDDLESTTTQQKKMTESSCSSREETTNTNTNSLNSTIDLNETTNTLASSETNLSVLNQPTPIDESSPFNFELNTDFYLYTNPIIMLTFSGIQSIKLTINNLKPTDLILEATGSGPDINTKMNNQIKDSQRPFLEINAQLGSIKCIMCPKQIHLLTEMINKLNDYIESVNTAKRTLKLIQQQKKKNMFSRLKTTNQNKVKLKQVRGCDKRKFETWLQNDLNYNNSLDYLDLEDENKDGENPNNCKNEFENDENFKSILNNEESAMFYSMMSESVINSNINNSNLLSKENENDLEINSDKSNNNNESNFDEDKNLILFSKNLKQTIEQLQTDAIKQTNNLNMNQNHHNLFQTFKITLRQLSFSLLHHDPPNSNEQTKANSKDSNQINSSKRLIVERMKQISDSYFDLVSTIETCNLTQSTSSSARIDKNTILKYHQPCAFNDHFLVLLKPINFNLIQKINQKNIKNLNSSSRIQYSLNDATLTVGYIQINEYLVADNRVETDEKKKAKKFESKNLNLRRLAIEACQSATITELIHFVDSNNSQMQNSQIEQPCLKAQLVFYDPIEPCKQKSNLKYICNSSDNEAYLLNRNFENIFIQINQSLVLELDISIIDRLYYILNDISKMTTNNPNKPSSQDQLFNKIQNFEIKCLQVVKIGLRFPIADLRRAKQPKTFFTKTNEMNSSTLNFSTYNHAGLKPVTMIAFRNLREQILTLHIFDLTFQTLLNAPYNKSLNELLLTLTNSQINAYYQYNKNERPIHFGLIQQRQNEPRSLLVSIKIPIENKNYNPDLQFLTDDLYSLNYMEAQKNTEIDSLKHTYNINISKANCFLNRSNQTIKEENEIENETFANEDQYFNEDEDDDDDDDDDDEIENCYGPFSKIHSLISSEKNRRIVNAGNRQEMNTFINESKSNSQIVIKLNLPDLKFLIADQKFLNDIYNCILNDLIMWLPTQLPPIESSLHIFDPVNNCFIAPSLNYLIESNLDTEFFFANAHISLQADFKDDDNNNDNDDKLFHMCKSAILKSPSSNKNSDNDTLSSSEECCESDNDGIKRKYKEKIDAKQKLTKQNLKTIKTRKPLENLICVILKIDSGHLKAFVLNNKLPNQPLKYGEFDVKLNNFQMCITSSENYRTDSNLKINKNQNKKLNKIQKQDLKSEEEKYKIEKQYISIFTDKLNVSHATKTCPPNINHLKLPTNYASFESLFQISKTKDLITLNDPNVSQCLFNTNPNQTSQTNLNNNINELNPMVSIAIKSKFNSKTNKKQLLVALNFNNLNLHHQFCSQNDFWIFQLIELFNLIDIEVIGYEDPIVLTELHLNVSNSSILYKPVHLQTRSLIGFKSLHWSSNVTAESCSTLLVFNIEDIYLFLSKLPNNNDLEINIKKDYVCVANTDLFELRLLINEEKDIETNNIKKEPRISPILDIKLRSNLIQFRTCVDSAFTLIELINYIVSDGDLHMVNPILSEFMYNQINMNPNTTINPTLEFKTQQSVIDELNSAIGISKAINIASNSIPIQPSNITFSVGTPPVSSLKSSSSSASLNQLQYYSPCKNNSFSSCHLTTAASSFQDSHNQSKLQSINAPLPSPSLSFDPKTIASSSQNLHRLNPSSSAESIISDMVKEAMSSNAMMQSVYGSLDSEPANLISYQANKNFTSGRKRNTSLNLDLQSKRMLSHDESCEQDLEEDELVQSNLTSKTLREKSLNEYRDDLSDLLNKNDEKCLKKTVFELVDEDEKENKKYSLDNDEDEDQDENLVNSIEVNRIKHEDDEFQFDMPFSDLSPMLPLSEKAKAKAKKSTLNASSFSYSNLISSEMKQQQNFKTSQSSSKIDSQIINCQNLDKINRKLYFKSNLNEKDDSFDYNHQDNDDDDDNDDELVKDFDIIDVIPGFGEPPRNNQEYEIKFLKTQQLTNSGSKSKQYKYTKSNTMTHLIEIKNDHFKKPLTKIDVLKAPENYPCPLNVYCVQDISINWFLYGGNDFNIQNTKSDLNKPLDDSNDLRSQKLINRTSSSPIMVNQNASSSLSPPQPTYSITRSRNNSTSSASLSISPHSLNHHQYQSPPKQQASSSGSPSQISINTAVKFSNSNKNPSVNISKEKYLQRSKAGGRIIKKYDNLNWLTRGGSGRNLDVCMEIALHKVKTKIDLYVDLNDMNESEDKKQDDNESPYLYRIALAIGDIEVRDKLASSSFNMFLFRYESENCPKHTNSNMIFFKFLCSKSMDAQRLLECDIKLSVQPLRFNIDQDALIFLIEFFQKLASKDLNEFSKNLVPPPPPPPATQQPIMSPSLTASCTSISPGFESSSETKSSTQQTPQQIFIRNFILAPDLFIKFDFSGKYDKRPDTKMDTLTKLLMVVVQLSNTEIKLKRIYYRRGFLGVEKLFQALIKEWVSDIQRNQMKNLIKGWGIFNSLIQFFEGFTYLIWYPIEQYKRDGRVLCGIQKGSAAFSTCTVLSTIELTNRMFQATKNIAEFFYDLVTPHRSNINQLMIGHSNLVSSSTLVDTLFTGVGNNRNIRIRRQPNDIREGLTNAYYVMYEGINDTAANLLNEINQGAENRGIPGAIGGVLRQLPSAALTPILLTSEATCNILSGIRNQLKPDEKKDDDQKWKTITFS